MINEQIRAKEVRLVSSDGEQLGVVSIAEAMAKAEEAELDLVLIAPTAKPPVCRLLTIASTNMNLQEERRKQRRSRR